MLVIAHTPSSLNVSADLPTFTTVIALWLLPSHSAIPHAGVPIASAAAATTMTLHDPACHTLAML